MTMRVEQQQNSMIDMLQQLTGTEEKGGVSPFQGEVIAKKSSGTGNQSVNVRDATYLKPEMEEKETIADELETGGALDATDRKNQMVVLAGTTSASDYQKMQEDGFSLDATTSNTIVTVTDKIKVQLAKAGVDISCFGDDLSLEQIQAITGSMELAMQLAESIQQADLPVDDDMIREAVEALSQSGALQPLGAGAIKYLLDNQLKPSIENLYMAEFCGSSSYRVPEKLDISSFSDQIEKVILSAGLPVDEDTLADSQWLLENDIPLTAEMLSYMEDLKNMSFPLDTEMVIDGITEAIVEGGSAKDALLIPGRRLMEQARAVMEVVEQASGEDVDYLADHGLALTVENLKLAAGQDGVQAAAQSGMQVTEQKEMEPVTDRVQSGTGQEIFTRDGLSRLTARRQLEEARLAMTVEANYALLRKGIAIDTEPLSQLIEQLKSSEQEYYVNLLKAQGIDEAEEKASVLMETTEKVAGIKTVPVYVLGLRQVEVNTIEGIHRAGTSLKDTFERANERYETLMVQPDAKMGDSIQKAFRNVDDILSENNLAVTEENRRAVRILAYNQLEITEENVAQMKAADEEVQRTFKNMTPAVVVQMIKRGINPLEMDISELNQAAEEIRSETGDEDKSRFSEYLWKLEQNHNISENERSAYIGIYRLIRQVENTDGAAVGAVVNQGAALTMKNLLTAVRSEKRSGRMDISMDDSYGELELVKKEGTSITDQIEAGYQFNCLKDVMDVLTPNMIKTVMEANPDWQDMTPEQLKGALQNAKDALGADSPLAKEEKKLDEAYARHQLEEFRLSAGASQDVYEILEKYDIPNTAQNILAMESMMKNRNQIFRQIFGSREERVKGRKDRQTEEKESVLNAFADALSDPETMESAQKQLNGLAEQVIEEAMNQDAVTSLDVRSMKLLHTQLSINNSLVKEEQYSIPVQVKDEIVNVSLKIVRGTETKGIVDVTMEQDEYGTIAATFQAKETGISGLVTSDNRHTKELLQDMAGHLKNLLSDGGDTVIDIHYAYINDLDINHFSMGAFGVEAENAGEAQPQSENYQVQTSRLYHMAESFICLLRQQL